MALNNCKECNKEVSTDAKTCPYCGINNPGVIDNNNRRVGVVVLLVLVFLGLYVITRHEKVEISKNKDANVDKVNQEANATQSLSERPVLMATAPKEALKPSQQALPQVAVPHEFAMPDKAGNISSGDTSKMMVVRMFEYALTNGGLSHELEIQQTKQQIERSPKPEKGNKKAARAINLKGLAALKEGDFNKAVTLFEQAGKLDESDVEIVNNLGFSYLKQGDFNVAQQVIISALTLSPGRTTAWENLGEVFEKKGQVNKALACFSNAYRFSKDRLTLQQYMKELNEKEDDKRLKQVREKSINWAEKTYLNHSKNTEPKQKVRHELAASKSLN
jgi:tetratricopeptide (TPR) repeat protein